MAQDENEITIMNLYQEPRKQAEEGRVWAE